MEVLPSKTYRIQHNRVIGTVDDLEAVKQAVDKIIQTPRFEHEIYSESYGHDFDEIIGEHVDLAISEVERLITEALEIDDRILSVDSVEIEQVSKNSLHVTYTISTIYGELANDTEVSL